MDNGQLRVDSLGVVENGELRVDSGEEDEASTAILPSAAIHYPFSTINSPLPFLGAGEQG